LVFHSILFLFVGCQNLSTGAIYPLDQISFSTDLYSYAESDDALRVSVAPQMVDDNQEELMYAVTNEGILFGWEKARLNIPVE